MKGQALVTLLVFVVISLIITSASVSIVLVNSLSASKFEQGLMARSFAESGIENALLRLLRDPGYTGETLNLNDGSATVTVAGTNPKTITSIGRIGNFTRTIEAQAAWTNYILSVTSWREIF